MKALTVYQPWASAECLGLKGNETRAWPTRYRGPLLIHAGVKWSAVQELAYAEIDTYLRGAGRTRLPLIRDLPFGVVLAVCDLVDCQRVTEENVTSFSMFESIAGDLSIGRYVWVLDRVKPLREPVRCRGAQGLWTPGDDLLSKIRSAS